ncbi:hypothetical protein SAMN06273572_105191 [Monaibacterium marinum]|uniref:Uncharacterized protein n=1 Tax=Pontivivens marinum TaxID=1690039 RepID=A0A2C9CU25_9RHOB|nr:hypothetical protein [Monaibacterium marinum]SOH94767.1 hypothetical protein SAMN06273572_105191 [Monaibacterium marinum]
MRIAILGWGSLIWDIENLEPFVTGDWQMSGGPALPMEFSRVSPKRKMGLAVCLDPEVGALCATHVIRSTRTDVQQAARDLAARERAPMDRIGWATAQECFGRLPAVNSRVMQWCAQGDYDAALWTDLEPTFHESQGQDFTVLRAIEYLKTLRGEQIEEAYRYIQEAPPTTMTPLRRALQNDPWWATLSAGPAAQTAP